MLDLTYQHQATTQLYVQALIGIFFWLALRDISIYADMTLAAIIYLGMSLDWPPESPDNQYHLFK
ncbi:hypothetical protein EIF91_28810 [Escherichia coli O45:H11]|nr:hypothetical protein [Escherichia coli O45:H11]